MQLINMFINLFSIALLLGGLVFFISGSFGLLRFPDVFCRLHAVTKADTLGLGLMALGLALQAESFSISLTLIVIWLLVLASGAVNCQLLARFSRYQGPDSPEPLSKRRGDRA